MEFKLSIFRFDAKTDYLPYFKKYKVKLDQSLDLNHLLQEVKKQDEFFEFEPNSCVFLNKYALCLDTSLKEIYNHFGNELQIKPLSTKRSYKDLIINDNDFKASINDLQEIFDQNISDDYEKYKKYFYASTHLKYDKDFYGTSLFLYAYKLIAKYPHLEEQILKIISHEQHGIWYHDNLQYKIYPNETEIEDVICELKKKILASFQNLNKHTKYYTQKGISHE